MSQEIHDFVPSSCELLALGEPAHQEPAFGLIRNELFAGLADRGFRSIALETDRVAGLAVDDFVQEGVGALDTVSDKGFSHGFGALDPNRRLVAWMREYNEGRPPTDRLSFHGFDAATETMNAPSPRSYLERARDYLKLDVDVASLIGDDERWSRTEAVLDPAMSPGATAEAEKLRLIADDLLTALYARAPELITATSRAEWFRTKTYLTAGIDLLRYHRQCAVPGEQGERVSHLSGVRDAIMARNLLDIRATEASRGPTLVFAHNRHLQLSPSTLGMWGMNISWSGAGAIVRSLLGDRYAFVAGSLGRSTVLGLAEPEPDTYEGHLQGRISEWGLTPATAVNAARTRTDPTPEQGYIPLDAETLERADAVLHVSGTQTSKTVS
jgi:erythromycin esterase-like protein